MTMAIQSFIARIRASVGLFASPADTSSARLSSSRPVHLISTRGRTRSGATRSSRGKSSTLAYLPQKKVIGLSKIPRIVDMFSRRLQIRERWTQEVAQTIQEVLD